MSDEVLREEFTQKVVKVKVESDSRPGMFHYVSLFGICTCEAFRFTNQCKHSSRVLDEIYEAEKERRA